MKFRPLHDRVVVRRVEEDTKTKGGIVIPDTAQEKPMQGEIIAVGPGGRDEAGEVGDGHRALVHPEAVDRHAPDRPLLGVEAVGAHEELAAGHPGHARVRRGPRRHGR